MIPPSLYVAAVLMLASFGAGWQIQAWRWKAAESAQIEQANQALVAEQKRSAEASKAYQEQLAKVRTKTRVIVNEVNREIEKPVYRDCVIPDNGRMLLDSAIDTANSPR